MDARNPKSEESSTPFLANNDGLRNDSLIHPLFTSVPALNEAASYLAETTSYITSCFSDFSAEPASRDSNGLEMVTFASGEIRGSLVSDNVSSSGSLSEVSESSNTATDAPPIHDGRSISKY